VRASTIYLLFVGVATTLFIILMLHSRTESGEAEAIMTASAGMVKELRLTDLCIFTEARYTRHPSMADLHSAFQDHPLSLEHFPSGSLMSPPAHVKGHYAPFY
jgi:hypothetical protein